MNRESSLLGAEIEPIDESEETAVDLVDKMPTRSTAVPGGATARVQFGTEVRSTTPLQAHGRSEILIQASSWMARKG